MTNKLLMIKIWKKLWMGKRKKYEFPIGLLQFCNFSENFETCPYRISLRFVHNNYNTTASLATISELIS